MVQKSYVKALKIHLKTQIHKLHLDPDGVYDLNPALQESAVVSVVPPDLLDLPRKLRHWLADAKVLLDGLKSGKVGDSQHLRSLVLISPLLGPAEHFDRAAEVDLEQAFSRGFPDGHVETAELAQA